MICPMSQPRLGGNCNILLARFGCAKPQVFLFLCLLRSNSIGSNLLGAIGSDWALDFLHILGILVDILSGYGKQILTPQKRRDLIVRFSHTK